MTWKLTTIAPVWVLAVLGAILVAALATPATDTAWISLVFAGCVLATFALQLIAGRAEGFVSRAMASITGALIICAVATFFFELVR